MTIEYTDEQIKIIENGKEARSTSLDEFIYRLEMVRNGANAHTVNKAILYLNSFSNSEKERYKYGEHYDRLDMLKSITLRALKTNDFEDLADWMKSWW